MEEARSRQTDQRVPERDTEREPSEIQRLEPPSASAIKRGLHGDLCADVCYRGIRGAQPCSLCMWRALEHAGSKQFYHD
ncbi:hypothetical protein RRG08_029366 [Elysia crispata]|uniref:Uncharacterized protein n=1 Tax=Elysia crispata TaxID=231223 RepID=A0AAE1EB84_9GAST|nr:hypothetical protein RRG08_029366 [Elysia crispata]